MSFAAAKAKIRDILEGILIRNLIENPSFEVDFVGVEADAGLSPNAPDASFYVVGAGSLAVVSSAGGANKTVYFTKADTNRFAVSENTDYTWSLFAHGYSLNGANITARIGVEWYDSGGSLISSSYGLEITDNLGFVITPTGDWQRRSYTKTAPENAVTARPFVRDASSFWSSGRTLYFDALMFNEGGLEDYVDGTMPGCAWEGTAHAAPSKRAVKRVYENPPNALQDVPCFIIWPGGQENNDRMGGWRVDWHEVRVTLAAGDQEWDRAAAILEAFRPIVVNAFRADPLDGYVTVLTGPNVEPGGFFPYGAKPYLGQDFTVRFRIG